MNKITKQNTFTVTLKADGSLFSVTPKGKRHTKPSGYTSYTISGFGMTLSGAQALASQKHRKPLDRRPIEDWQAHDHDGIH